jgi:hypothetical protein
LDQQYFIQSRGRVQGPFTEAQLHKMARRGKFSRHYQVSLDRQNWEPASTHPELFPAPGAGKIRRTPAPNAGDDTGIELAEVVDSPETEPADTLDQEVADAGQTDATKDEIRFVEVEEQPVAESEPQWYYTRGGQQQGPVSMDQLQFFASTGQLLPEEHLWMEGMPDWVPARLVPGVFPDGVPAAVDTGSVAVRSVAPLAVASFVSGLLGASLFFFLGSILAVVFGHVALKQINESGDTLGGRGMAISGLVLGYAILIAGVVVGLVVLCIVLLPDSLTGN